MFKTKDRMILVDLVRTERQGFGAQGTAVVPARLPCRITGDDFGRLRSYAAGETAACEVTLAFRYQDLDDLQAEHVMQTDHLAGLYDTCGAPLLRMPEHLHLQVASTHDGGDGVSLGRPGRYLLCARFQGASPAHNLRSSVAVAQPTDS